YSYSLPCHPDLRHVHSLPTRRSSDLGHRPAPFRGQGRPHRPDQALRLHGACAPGGPGRRDRRPGQHRLDPAGQQPGGGRGHPADLGAPDHQPGGAQDPAYPDRAARPPAGRGGRAPGGTVGMSTNSPAGRVAIARLDSASPDFDARLRALLHYEASQDAAIEKIVAEILADVRERGDAALVEHTRRLDGLEVDDAAALEIPAAELRSALDALPPARREALEAAADRIRA